MSPEDLDPTPEHPRLEDVLDRVCLELLHAQNRYPPFTSTMEAEAVLREEMDELTRAIRKGYHPEAPRRAGPPESHEALQLAAMAIRFLLDCLEPPLD